MKQNYFLSVGLASVLPGRCVRVGLFAGVLVSAAGLLRADDVTWSSAVDGDWSTSSNWSTSALPGSADDVTIAATTGGTDPYTVTFGTGTGDDSSLTADVANLALGASGAPYVTLELKGGTMTSDGGAVSAAPMTMTNSGLLIDSGATLTLRTGGTTNGYHGLTLSGGASVTVNGTLQVLLTTALSSGTPGGGLFMTGTAGQTNTFTVGAGGVANFGYSNIGASGGSATSENDVIVDGGQLSVRSLELGRSGSASLTVKNGGTLAIGGSGASIGGGTGGSGSGELIIGESGGASEGTVTFGFSTLSVGTGNTSGKGTITLNAGSFTAASTGHNIILANGASTTGTLNINGGVLDLTGSAGTDTLTLAPAYTDGATGTATVNLAGGTLNVDKLVSQTVAGTINFTSGLFTVKQATVSNGKAFVVGDGTHVATLRLLTGTGSGNHTFADGLVISSQARLEGAGRIATGSVSVAGTVAASGAMEFADGLSLADGSTIDLNASGSLTISGGSIDIADGSTINVLLSSFTEGDEITLFSIAGTAVAADLDDVTFKLNGVAATGAWNGSDFQIAATAIPEPAVGALLLGGLAAAFVLLRRRRA